MRRLLTSLLLFGVGCSPYVHSPPGRTMPLESPKALHVRETGVQVEGGAMGAAELGMPGFSVRVRHGIVKQLDGSAEFNFGSIRPDKSFRFVGANPFVFSGRIGVKYAIIDHVALTAGCSLGSWAGGAFVSPDMSLIVGYENRYVVPFATIGGYTSHPFRTKLVSLENSDPGESFVGLPVLTWGWSTSFGLRIPIGGYDSPDSTPPSVLLGFGVRNATFNSGWDVADVSVIEGRRKENYLWGSIGFEYVFAPKR
ncbi:MAG: hypothetical protein KJO40_10795 [Deltaproteobacteria bacterium]|nr:hypothetical protein [Deltaproteobacteria bacterium]NND28957.1 hypothetical protein [Myxococcales bacterium]MBT8463315.1 hypothetical protein [Deltaproteobacteria bacterium]MBT8481641.1 hypothetical protein [Deltaproteobacteria bacterium]NNK09012.1 hypothetical protein [Myxococcales bacterium]